MKHMLKEITNHAKENPKDFTMSVILLVGIFAVFYIAMSFNASINGNY